MSSSDLPPTARSPMKRTPDSMTVMNDPSCPSEVEFPLLGEKSVRDNALPNTQQSLRGKQVLDRLLTILSLNLESRPTSNVSQFPPSLLFTICDAVQQGLAEDSVEHSDAPVLPSVLSKLRTWRLLDPAYRHSPEGVQNLALDLASITNEPPTSADHPRSSPRRLRMKWVSSDSLAHVEIQDRESPPSPSCVLDETQEWAHAHPRASEHSADDALDSCQADGLGVLGFESVGGSVSRRHHSVSTFRSGCAACRHPRVSCPSTPRTPQAASSEQRTLPGDRGLSEVHITPSSRRPKSISQNSTTKSTTKKTKRGKPRPLQSISPGVEVDENEPPLPRPIIVQQGIGISFPRQRIHSPPISNSRPSRESSSTSSPVASTKGILQPSHVPNRTREDDKRTFSHRIPSVNVDLRLPIGASRASPTDLHSPSRAQSLSYTVTLTNMDHRIQIHPHGPGSVDKVSNPKPTRREAGSGSRSSKRPERLLPLWSQPHPTMTSKPASSSSLPRSVKGSPPPSPSTRSSSSSTRTKTPSDAKDRPSPSVSLRTSTDTSNRSTFKFPSPPLQSRKWLV